MSVPLRAFGIGVLTLLFAAPLFASALTCTQLTNNMSLGVSDVRVGGQVSALQRFLTETGDFTYGEITGYFGPVTAQAVQRFQCREMQLCNGGAETNGYGVVGPQTRAAIARVSCGGAGTATSETTRPSSNASCVTPWGASVAHGTSVIAYQSYLLQSYPSQTRCPSEMRACYNGILSGSYTDSSCSYSLTTPPASASLSVTPSSGVAPLYTTFNISAPANTYTLSFGDGSSEIVNVTESTNSLGISVNHSYAAVGTYTATLSGTYACSSGICAISKTATVIVRDGTATACTADAMQCADGSWVGRTGPNCEFQCPIGTGGTGVKGTPIRDLTRACVTPWGAMIENGSSVIAYKPTTPLPFPYTNLTKCPSETRICREGVLSGSYSSAACSLEGGTWPQCTATQCATRGTSSCNPASCESWIKDIVGVKLGVTPTSGLAPLRITLLGSYSVPSRTASEQHKVRITFGDGSDPIEQECRPITALQEIWCSVTTISHTYAAVGTYLITVDHVSSTNGVGAVWSGTVTASSYTREADTTSGGLQLANALTALEESLKGALNWLLQQ